MGIQSKEGTNPRGEKSDQIDSIKSLNKKQEKKSPPAEGLKMI